MIGETIQAIRALRLRRRGGSGARQRRGPKPVGAGMRLAPGVRDVWSRFLIARLMWILLMTVFVTAGAGAFLVMQKPMYRSQATVAIYPASGATSAVQPFVMGTEKGVASSGAVLSLASQSLLIPVSKLQSGLSITIPVDSDLLVISYKDPDPQVAQSVAEAIAQAYVAYRTTALGPTNAKAGSSSNATLQAAVINDATLPSSPDAPNPLLTMGVALVLGISLGIGLALILDWLDDRLRGPADLQAQSKMPVLAQIPAFDRKEHGMEDGLIIVEHPNSPVTDAYIDLRTRVLQAATPRRAKTILVTSPGREDKSTVAANLAAAIAISGRRVVLVCADLREGNAELLFRLRDRLGVTSVVAGDAELADALSTTRVHGLEVLGRGAPSPDPSSVLQSRAFKDLLQMLRAGADMVVIEAPSVLACADCAAMAEETEMVLLVADSRISSRAEVRAAVEELSRVRARLIGCVLDNLGRAVKLGAPAGRPAMSPRSEADDHMDDHREMKSANGNGEAVTEQPHALAAAIVIDAAGPDAGLAAMAASNGAAHTHEKTKRRRNKGRNEL